MKLAGLKLDQIDVIEANYGAFHASIEFSDIGVRLIRRRQNSHRAPALCNRDLSQLARAELVQNFQAFRLEFSRSDIHMTSLNDQSLIVNRLWEGRAARAHGQNTECLAIK